MLDFYLIDDEQSKPNDPQNLVLIGSLDEKTFSNLKTKGIIGNQYDFYSDFRLSCTIVKQIQDLISRQLLQADTDVKQLLQILDGAMSKQCGVIAYGD